MDTNLFLEVLYYIFIYPMQSVLGFFFDILYSHIGSYGLSIITLSVLINVFLLKLVSLADSKTKVVGALKAVCDSKILEFKRVFRGAELHTYIKTLYKQKHYHPIYGFFSLGGLFLQVPFFLGVFFLLKNLEGLKGVSFVGISDLSKADNLLFGFNLLPLLMCVFSLINVHISSQEKSSRIQGGVIALIFLVLLYAMPSALVLYWTTSMAFALFKTLLNKLLAHKHLQKDTASHNASKSGSFNAKNKQCQSEFSSYLSRGDSIHKASDVAICARFSKLFHAIFTPYKELDSKSYITYRNISIFALLNIFFLIFVFSPYAVYSSDVSQFDPSQTFQTLGGLFGFFLLFSFLGIYITSFFYKTRLLKLGVYGVSVILLIGLTYTFVLTGDYGAMDRFVFQKLSFADTTLRMQKYLYAFITLGISAFLTLILLRRLSIVFKIIFITQVSVSCIYAFNINIYSTSIIMDTSLNMQEIKNNARNSVGGGMLSYSKNEKNIVVFLLDMFSGSHTPYLLEQFPELKVNLDGFVLFDNTISTTDSTIHSVSTLIAGEYYSTYNMNARGDNIVDSINHAYGSMGLNFANEGYNVNYALFALPTAGNIKPILDNAQNKINIINIHPLFLHYYLTKQGILESVFDNRKDSIDDVIVKFSNFGLFRFVPELYFRPKVYNNGFWIFSTNFIYKNVVESISYSASFYGFTHLNSVDSDKPTFKFLHSIMTHVPYGMYYNNGKCEFFNTNSAWNDNKFNVNMNIKDGPKSFYYQHYDTEACALKYLGDYIQWLKDNGIYDNTQIFVISDHSGLDSINIPIDSRPDALFLFKDFNSRGALKQDSRLMANYDVASIFCANLSNGCKNVPKNILKHYPQNRTLIHTIPHSWMIEEHKVNHWILNKIYQVKDNIYDPKNWTDITEETKKSNYQNIQGLH